MSMQNGARQAARRGPAVVSGGAGVMGRASLADEIVSLS